MIIYSVTVRCTNPVCQSFRTLETEDPSDLARIQDELAAILKAEGWVAARNAQFCPSCQIESRSSAA